VTVSPTPDAEPTASSSGPPVPISVTVSTVQGWPEVAAALATLRASAEAAGGEVVVADGSGKGPAPADALGSSVRWLSQPGASIFQLRHATYQAAAGQIVAVTEDHVHVPREWASRHVAAHAANPEALAIGGSVLNGATDGTMDWASFLIVQAPVAAPMPSGPAKRLSGAVNVSYKRPALSHIDTFDGLGAMDGLHQRELAKRGGTLINDDSIRVSHVQSLGFRGTTAIHFHAGRTISGFRRRRMDLVQVARLLGAPFVPLVRYVRTVALLGPRGYGTLVLRCTPAILWLLYSQGLGQFVGYLAGEGDSPRRVQ
jgi:hypothetical protein